MYIYSIIIIIILLLLLFYYYYIFYYYYYSIMFLSFCSMGEVDYESLPTDKLWAHLLAGGAAGVTEHCVMYPVDCVKVRRGRERERGKHVLVAGNVDVRLVSNIYYTLTIFTNLVPYNTHASCYHKDILIYGYH